MNLYKPLPTTKQLHILLLINDNKQLCYKDQNVYRCERSFDRSMEILIKAGWVKLKSIDYYNFYRLTLEGAIVAQDIIKPFIRKVGR